MPAQQFKFLHPRSIDGDLSRRLRELADDLGRIAEGSGPSADALAAAPLLDQWRHALTRMGVRLIGKVSGHPKLLGGRIMTSPLWVVDPYLRWTRSTNRYYRLGVRSNEDDPQTDYESNEDLEGMLR